VPIQGTFLADFESFYDAARAAQQHLDAFQERSDAAAASLDRMTAGLDAGALVADAEAITAAIDAAAQSSVSTAEAMAGVSDAVGQTSASFEAMGQKAAPAIGRTRDELAQLPPTVSLGQTALEGMRGATANLTAQFVGPGALVNVLGSVLGTVKDFVGNTIESADAIGDQAAKFGISTDAVQRFQYVADATGVSFGTLAGAARELSKRVAEGDDSTEAALRKVGLSLTELQGLAPDEMFARVGAAIAEISGPGEQVSATFDLMGKKGVEAIGAINSGLDELTANAPVMDRAVVGAFDKIKASSDHFFTDWKVSIQNHIGLWAVLIEEGPMKTMEAYARMRGETGPTMDEMNAKLETTKVQTESNIFTTGEYEQVQRELTASAKDSIEANKALAEAEKEVAKNETEITRIRSQLFGFDVLDKADKYVAAIGDVNEVSKLSEETQKKVNVALKEALEVYKQLGIEAPESVRALVNATETQLIPVIRSFSAEAAGMFVELQQGITDAKVSMDVWENDWRRLGGTSREELDATAIQAEKNYADVLRMSDHFTAAQIENYRRLAEAARAAADNWGQSFVDAAPVAEAGIERVNAALDENRRKAEDTAEAVRNTFSGQGQGGFTLPTVNPITGAGMMGTDSRVTTDLMMGYTLDEAIARRSGQGMGIMGPRGTWTASGYMYGIQTDPFAQAFYNQTGAAGSNRPLSPYNPANTGTNVTVNVGNLVGSERELVERIQAGMVDAARSTGTRLPARA
jgi:hypothetical protein